MQKNKPAKDFVLVQDPKQKEIMEAILGAMQNGVHPNLVTDILVERGIGTKKQIKETLLTWFATDEKRIEEAVLVCQTAAKMKLGKEDFIAYAIKEGFYPEEILEALEFIEQRNLHAKTNPRAN